MTNFCQNYANILQIGYLNLQNIFTGGILNLILGSQNNAAPSPYHAIHFKLVPTFCE